MKKRKLGRTGIEVSELCLGTMTFGEQNHEAESFALMDQAWEAGIDIFDTAEMYAVPPREETYGESERLLGKWVRERGLQGKAIVASKAVGPAGKRFSYIRGGQTRLDAANLTAACEASLKRMGLETIDLYQTHWPDRDIDPFGTLWTPPGGERPNTPIEETLRALEYLVTSGKVRAVGVSNETPWGVMRHLQIAETGGGPRIATIQNPYSLLNRSFETRLAEIALAEDCGLFCYAPVGAGMLTGKYQNGAMPEGARFTLFPSNKRYRNPQGEAATAAYLELAAAHGLEPAQMALAFVLAQPFLSSAILGATKPAQLANNLKATELTLSVEVLDGLESIHATYTYPCP